MTRSEVQRWLERYVEAWRSYDTIVEDWRGDQDEPGSCDASYAVSLVDGDRATARGETRYANGRTFSNLFELRFDDAGLCTEFVEWYVVHPA
jgi:hypothetical protein